MKTKARPGNYSLTMVRCIAFIASAALISAGLPSARARHVRPQGDQQAVKIPPDQLDSLVAPIALYPDNLLSQTLVASTYPLEIIQLQQWLEKNPDLLLTLLLKETGPAVRTPSPKSK